jgi:hypothetical protein
MFWLQKAWAVVQVELFPPLQSMIYNLFNTYNAIGERERADQITTATRLSPGSIGPVEDRGVNQRVIWIRLSIQYVARVLRKWVLIGH